MKQQKTLFPNGIIAVIKWEGQPCQVFIEKPPRNQGGTKPMKQEYKKYIHK